MKAKQFYGDLELDSTIISKKADVNVVFNLKYETDGENCPAPKYIGAIGMESGPDKYSAAGSQIMGYLSGHEEKRRVSRKRKDPRPTFSDNDENFGLKKPVKGQQESSYEQPNFETLPSFKL